MGLSICKGFQSSEGLKGAKLEFTWRIRKLEMKLFGVFVSLPCTHYYCCRQKLGKAIFFSVEFLSFTNRRYEIQFA